MKPSQVPATLQVGKDGVTDAWIEELREQVKRRKLVKVRLMRSARGEGTESVAADIAARAGLAVLDVRGSTATFGEPGAGRAR